MGECSGETAKESVCLLKTAWGSAVDLARSSKIMIVEVLVWKGLVQHRESLENNDVQEIEKALHVLRSQLAFLSSRKFNISEHDVQPALVNMAQKLSG